jgi:hypothetical protein
MAQYFDQIGCGGDQASVRDLFRFWLCGIEGASDEILVVAYPDSMFTGDKISPRGDVGEGSADANIIECPPRTGSVRGAHGCTK